MCKVKLVINNEERKIGIKKRNRKKKRMEERIGRENKRKKSERRKEGK